MVLAEGAAWSYIVYNYNVLVKLKLQHPPGIPGHLTPLPSRGGGNLIRVFQGVGHLIAMPRWWGI